MIPRSMKATQVGSRYLGTLLIVLGIVMTTSCRAEDPHVRKDVMGMSETEVVQALGPPTAEQELDIDAGSKLPEYQSSLYDAVPESGSLRVKELTWKTEAETTKVWLKREGDQWVVFDNLVWSKDIRF